MGKKRLLAIAVCTVVLMALFAGTALAGEVTGSGENSEQNQGVSWCSFSGLNDDPTASTEPPIGPNGPGGQSQSYGQDVRLGLAEPNEGGPFHPGEACNPNKTIFPPQPNRTK